MGKSSRTLKRLRKIAKQAKREHEANKRRERAIATLLRSQRQIRNRVNPVIDATATIRWQVVETATQQVVGEGERIVEISGRKHEIEAIANEKYEIARNEIEQSEHGDLVFRRFLPVEIVKHRSEPTRHVSFKSQTVRGVNTIHTTDVCDQNNTARCFDDWFINNYTTQRTKHSYESIDKACGPFNGRTIKTITDFLKSINVSYNLYDAFGDQQLTWHSQTKTKRRPTVSAVISNGHFFPIVAIDQKRLAQLKRLSTAQPTEYRTTDIIHDVPCLSVRLMSIMIGNYSGHSSTHYVKCMPQIVYKGKSIKEIRYTDETGNHTLRANPMYGIAPPSMLSVVYDVVELSKELVTSPWKSLISLLTEKAKIIRSAYASHMSKETTNTMCMKGGEIWADMLPKHTYTTFDMSRCRANILITHAFPQFKLGDECRPFSGKLHEHALYHIQSSNSFFNFGNHWYCGPEVIFAREMGYDFTIIHEVVASAQVPAGYFAPLQTQANLLNEGENMTKTIMNAFIGTLVRNKTYTTYQYTTNEEDAHYRAEKMGANHCSVILKNEQDTLMRIGKEHVYNNTETCWPVYSWVLAYERVNCHRLAASMKLPIIAMHTDSVTVEGKHELPTQTWANGVAMWKLENKPIKQIVKRDYTQPAWIRYVKPWKIKTDPGHNDFTELANHVIENGANITAPAGCGKTTLLRTIMRMLDEQKKSFIVMTTTHSACEVLRKGTNARVETCKKYSSIFENGKLHVPKYAIIDEGPFAGHETIVMLSHLRRHGCKIIYSGDPSQLKPVNNIGSITTSDNEHLKHLCHHTMVELSVCRRSDHTLFNACMAIRAGGIIDKRNFPPRVCDLAICYRNKTRRTVNNEITARLFKDTIDVDGWLCATGMRLIGRKNNSMLKNGLAYVLTKIDTHKNTFTVSNTDGSILDTWSASAFINNFNPGYCITIHNAQGTSIDEHYAIYEWDAFKFKDRKELRYVALSRGTLAEYVHIM